MINNIADIFAEASASGPAVVGPGSGASDCDDRESRSSKRHAERKRDPSYKSGGYFGSCNTSYYAAARATHESGHLHVASSDAGLDPTVQAS